MADSTMERRHGAPGSSEMGDDGLYREDAEYPEGHGGARGADSGTIETQAQSQLASARGTTWGRDGEADTRGARQPEGRWPHRRVAVFAGLWVAGAAALTTLSVAAHTSSTFPADPPIAKWVQGLSGTPLGGLTELAGNANWPLPAIIGLVVIFATLLIVRLFREAICAAVAGFGADLLNLGLNTVVARPRPNGIHIPTLGGLGSHSFPSGHVAHTLGLYGFLFYLCWRAQRSEEGMRWRPWLVAVQVVAAVFILSAGPSRILEREHWPSDVLAGYLVGLLTLLAAIGLYHVLQLREGGRSAQGGHRGHKGGARNVEEAAQRVRRLPFLPVFRLQRGRQMKRGRSAAFRPRPFPRGEGGWRQMEL